MGHQDMRVRASILYGCWTSLYFFLGSGESGAGKTESTKLLLQHIMNLCKGNSQLEQQILQVGHCRVVLADAEATLLQGSLHEAPEGS